jgi:hypothetical protein
MMIMKGARGSGQEEWRGEERGTYESLNVTMPLNRNLL